MAKSIDTRRLPNPYDFSHPVTDPNVFSGREQILEDIRYYLDHASIDRRPINLALLGPRASGKTSLLNHIQWEARSHHFSVARVNLNESDAKSDLAFFFKLFDAIFTAACLQPLDGCDDDVRYAFGGSEGRTYAHYMEMTSSFAIPEERQWRPFAFPTTFANAMSAGRTNVIVSEAQFARDLELIRDEVDAPIVILIDECNVLAHSRVLLQKLRTIFMNLPGYMLVVSGTPELFPVMDEVFSPISRDFKRIVIGSFESREEARECVLKPLRSIGIDNPRSVIDPETLEDLTSPEGLASASPYQIQLICHFLFRNAQNRQPLRLALNLDVLDDVLDEVGSGDDVRSSRIVRSLRDVPRRDLRLLSRLLMCNRRATFDQIWFLQRVLFDVPDKDRTDLKDALTSFESLGLVNVVDGLIGFGGDERELIYAKYYAAKKGVNRLISPLDPSGFFAYSVRNRAVGDSNWRPLTMALGGIPSDDETHDLAHWIAKGLTEGVDFQEVTGRTSRRAIRDLFMQLYGTMIESFEDGQQSIRVANLTIRSPWWPEQQIPIVLPGGENQGGEDLLERISDIQTRAREFDVEVLATIETYGLPDADSLVERVVKSDSVSLRDSLARSHIRLMAAAYLNGRVDQAFKHRDRGYRLSPQPHGVQYINNLAYAFLVDDRLDEAEALLEGDVDIEGEPDLVAMMAVNLGTLKLKRGDPGGAVEQFEVAVTLAEGLDPIDRKAGCLIVVKLDGERVCFAEQIDPDLLEVAKNGRSVAMHLADREVDEEIE